MRTSLRTKLLVAFAVVLAPVLGLLQYSFLEELERAEQSALEAQALTAQAVAVQVDQAFAAALGLAWTVAHDPSVRSMDPGRLDEHLQDVLEHHPQYDAINVFDLEGVNRGWGHRSEPAEPRLRVGDRPYFRKALATNAPVISEVLELRRPRQLGFVVCVPIRDPQGRMMGVVNVVARADMLADGYAAARLHPGQAIDLIDRTGRLAFTTLHHELSFAESVSLQGLPALKAALAGERTFAPEYLTQLDPEPRMGAFVPTPQHGWVVGVSLPRELALAPAKSFFHKQLLAWVGILCFSLLLASVWVRFLSRPVMRLQEHAGAIGAGDLTRRVEIRTGDELEQLGHAFNQMASQLAVREEALKRSERLAAVGELAAVIAHEVRNPLGVIFNAVSALRRNSNVGEEASALHAILQEEADRLNRIVGDLLDFARPLQPELETHDVVDLVREAVSNVMSGAVAVSLEESYAHDLPPVSLDRRMLRQAVLNVGTNAVQSMPDGGALQVCVGRRSRGGTDGVCICFRDEGSGIPPDVRSHIFEPFFTTKAKGTGLGLAVVKRIVADHGGEILVESDGEKGTLFTIWLPAAEAMRAAS